MAMRQWPQQIVNTFQVQSRVNKNQNKNRICAKDMAPAAAQRHTAAAVRAGAQIAVRGAQCYTALYCTAEM